MIKKFMGRNKLLLTAIVVILLLSGCTNNPAREAGYTNITPEEAEQRLASNEQIIILDVRTEAEYKTGHITKAVLIPLTNLEEEVEQVLKDKEIPIFVYCRSGSRSAAASDILVKLGYSQVYNLGGINNWPYEVVR